MLELADNATFESVKAVAVSSAVGDYYCSSVNSAAYGRLRELTEEFYGFTDSATEAYLGDVRERLDQIGDLFSVDASELPEPDELIEEASEQLDQLAVQEQESEEHALIGW